MREVGDDVGFATKALESRLGEERRRRQRLQGDFAPQPGSELVDRGALIPGVNDADEHADELAHRVRNVRCCVNVIPYNPRRDSPWPAPEERDVQRFLDRLESHGQFCKRRRTKGRDTMAACGQLGNERIRGRRLVED